MRSLSNKMDDFLWNGGYKDTSGTRGSLHRAYHYGVGVVKFFNGNKEGASAKINRGNE